jgi:SAM-dependent methyltransferase
MTSAAAQTWHYGLVSRWWAEFNLDGPEIEWFRPFVEAGQPALDAACGTGRLLVPYLKAGLDVDGSDISPDMLERVRERCEREGLPEPNLYAQAMHELDLPRRYRTIIVCGGFGLGGEREHDVEGLRRIYEHLEPGGTLVLDKELLGAPAPSPRPWRDAGARRSLADGSELELRNRTAAFDSQSRTVTLEIRALLLRHGELVAEEEGTLKETFYSTHELELMLRAAGFDDIEVRGALSDRPPTADDDFVVFIARKPLAPSVQAS